ncbi:MAG: DUF6680 family protein [Methylococcaceae bacterium]
MGWTVKITDIAIVFATLCGPVLAVQAQKWLEHGRAIKERRLWIFRTLIATRASRLSASHVDALNAFLLSSTVREKNYWRSRMPGKSILAI